MAERSDAPLADEPQPGAVPNDMPSGMPDTAEESKPLGGDKDAAPEGEGDRERGEHVQPGLNQEEPDVSG